MCVIAVCKERKLTELEAYYCWTNNPDGAGIAWQEGNQQAYFKGIMKFKHFMKKYREVDHLPHIVHFRIASSGSVTPFLTHPFICKDRSPLPLNWKGESKLLFHNGIIYDWKELSEIYKITPTIHWSDTRLMSHILSSYSESLLTYESKSSKFVILNEGNINLYGKFEDGGGVLFSNESYKEYLYDDYFVVTPEGNIKKCRKRKKGRIICNNRNVQQIACSSQNNPGHNRNYSKSWVQQKYWAGD